MQRLEPPEVEALESVLTLVERSDGGAESLPASGSMVERLLPDLPVRTLVRVHLLEREEPPIEFERAIELGSNIAEPCRTGMRIGAEIVDIDVDCYWFRHGSLPGADKREMTLENYPFWPLLSTLKYWYRRPSTLDLKPRLIQGAAVVDHDVGNGASRFERRLRRDPAPRFLLAQSAAKDESL